MSNSPVNPVHKDMKMNEYFTQKYTITKNGLNIEIHYHTMTASKREKIEEEIDQTVKNFEHLINSEFSHTGKPLKIYIFNNKEDYYYLGNKDSFNFNYKIGYVYAGLYNHQSKNSDSAEIYIYQKGNVNGFKHELAHHLTYTLTDGNSNMPRALIEGIADYCEHHLNARYNTQGWRIDTIKKAMENGLDIDKILALTAEKEAKAKTAEETSETVSAYDAGHALVLYLQKKHPDWLKEYLNALAKRDLSTASEKLEQLKALSAEFSEWLTENSTDVAMADLNALKVTKGDLIATKKEIVDGEIVDVTYYEANIIKRDGTKFEEADKTKVGVFSVVEYISIGEWTRLINKATGNYFDLSKKYNSLKVIKNSEGEYRLTFSDEYGNEYKNSETYKSKAFEIIAKYNTRLKNKLDKFNLLMEERALFLERHQKKEVTDEQLYHIEDTKYKPAYDAFQKLKDATVNNINSSSKENEILINLINVNPHLIRDAKPLDLAEGKIYSINPVDKNSGVTGNNRALSLYDGQEKVGELLSESGFFKQIEGQSGESFIFGDTLYNLHVRYDGGAYLAVTEKEGQYEVSFIDGRKVSSDEHSQQSHLHKNEFLNPGSQHINAENLPNVLLQDNDSTQVISHQESADSQYSKSQKEKDAIVERGALLDDKGTVRKSDDVHEATLTKAGALLHKFTNMGFYITEEIKDNEGNIVSPSTFFIHDHGKNIRHQLPEEITYLKLKKVKGEYKLAITDKHGNEYGQKQIPDEYRYIDPVFAHEYAKRDYSHKHANIGLVNFSKYQEGSIFSIKYDANDYHIQKNAQGEIVRLSDDHIYFTKAKLFFNDKEIGMLSNDFHNFKGNIFFSVDYNYSYSDFFTSFAVKAIINPLSNGGEEITFDQSKADIPGTNQGYTDHKKIFTKVETTQEEVKAVNHQSEIRSVTLGWDDMNKLYKKARDSEPENLGSILNIWHKVAESKYETKFPIAKKDFDEISISAFIHKMKGILEFQPQLGSQSSSNSHVGRTTTTTTDGNDIHSDDIQQTVELVGIQQTQECYECA